MSGLLRGYAIVSLCGWAVFPLVRRALGSLPDRGYSMCRCFGWILTAWLAWILAWMGRRPLTTSLALGSLALVGASCWLPVLLGRRHKAEAQEGVAEPPVGPRRRRLLLIVCIEVLFVAGTLLFGSLQARNPAVDPDSERFMDYALLQACLRSPGLPVTDPWMAGAPTVYYHFGYALVAFLVRACGLEPALLFTAAIALSHALLWIGAFGIGLGLTGRARGGAWAAFLVLGAGNMEWIRQGLGAFRSGTFDWFASSRTIQGTITEVPWFSLLWGDLHPYVISSPIVVCALAFVLADWPGVRSAERGTSLGGGAARVASGRTFCFALASGAVLAVHPWDFPLLLGVALAVALSHRGGWSAARLLALLLAGSVGCMLFLPFVTGPASGARGFGWIVERSSPIEWLLAYAPFTLLGILASPWIFSAVTRRGRGGDDRGSGGRLALMLAGCALVTALLGEVVYVRDVFESTPLLRMNTIFKLHRFSWLLLGLSSASLLEWLVAPDPQGGGTSAARAWDRRSVVRSLTRWLVPAVVLGASLVYPIFGTAAWLKHRGRELQRLDEGPAREALRPGADAEALFRALFTGDAAAVRFIARSAAAGDHLLEESGDPYSWSSRITTFSGVPAILGWGNHEAVWRQGWDEVQRRQSDIALAYTHPGSPEACERLRAYGVTWVVWGDRERRRFGESSSDPERLARPVFAEAGTAVFLAKDLCDAARGAPQP